MFSIFLKEYFGGRPTSVIKKIKCFISGEIYSYESWSKYETQYILEGLTTNDKQLDINYTDYSNIDVLFKDIQNSVERCGGTCNIG